jgi:hypothetical protein
MGWPGHVTLYSELYSTKIFTFRVFDCLLKNSAAFAEKSGNFAGKSCLMTKLLRALLTERIIHLQNRTTTTCSANSRRQSASSICKISFTVTATVRLNAISHKKHATCLRLVSAIPCNEGTHLEYFMKGKEVYDEHYGYMT